MTLSPEYAFLGFLAQQPAHGYELHQRLTTELGQVWRASVSQTYNILNRLERQGFIAGTVQEQAKRPDRTRFRLTAAGRRRFNTWLHAVAPGQGRAVRLEFTTRLFFANALQPELVPEIVEAQAAEIRARLAQLQSLLADLPPDQILNRQSLLLRVRQLALLLDWVEECRVALEARSQP
jgi:PadR family transcriptional regulator, regulatory protein AphA